MASVFEKKVNTETSADSSGTTCDVMVCLIVSSTLTAIELGQARPIYRFLFEDGKCFFADVDALIEA